MKNIILIISNLLLCFAINAQTIVSTEISKRNAILEEFTGVNCGYCPDGHRIANLLATNNPGRFFAINIHQGGYANVIPDYRTEFGDAICAQSGLSGYPMGTINRHAFFGSNTAMDRGSWSNCAAQIMAQDSYVNIAAISTIDVVTRELSVTVELYYTANATVETNFLNVALLQNNILGPQAGMSFNPDQIIDGKYNHTHMLRHLLTGQWGDIIETTSEGTFVSKTYLYTIPEHLRNVEYDLHNLEVVVFIAEGTQEIITGTKSEMLITNGNPVMKALKVIETYSCDNEVLLSATVYNFTDEEITELNFTYKINGEENTFLWNNKTIAPMVTDTIHFNRIPVISGEEYTISVSLTSYNNNDEIIGALPFDVVIKKSVHVAHGELFVFYLITDRYASQTTYKFFDEDGNVVMSGGPFPDLNNNNTTERQFVFEPSKPGCYKLEVYDSAGNGINSGNGAGFFKLEDTEDNIIFIDDGKFGYQANYYINVDFNTSIDNYKPENDIVIYPNPVYDVLYIDTKDANISINVINLQGQNIISTNKKEIDVSKLANGIYFINIKTDKGLVVKKFMKR